MAMAAQEVLFLNSAPVLEDTQFGDWGPLKTLPLSGFSFNFLSRVNAPELAEPSKMMAKLYRYTDFPSTDVTVLQSAHKISGLIDDLVNNQKTINIAFADVLTNGDTYALRYRSCTENWLTDSQLEASLDEGGGTVQEISFIASGSAPQLDKVLKPTWDGMTIKWEAVSNASYYRLKLYAGDRVILDYNNAGANGLSYDLESDLVYWNAAHPGLLYTVTIQALGSGGGLYTDGPESDHSEPYSFNIAPLPRVAQPSWAKKVITWKDVANAERYEVKLYNASAECIDTQTVNKNTQRYDYTDLIENYLPAGSYTATVQALPGVSE